MSEQFPISVWPVAQENSGTQRRGRYLPESMAHPGKMLPAVARIAIERYTNPGDLVVDPMCGIGTTLVEAAHLGRDGFGVEYEQRWSDLANANVAHARGDGATGTARAVCGDGRKLASLTPTSDVGRAALVITSPPYGPSLHGQVVTKPGKLERSDDHYSKDRSNLEYASTTDLYAAFGKILRQCFEVLRPGGIVVVTTRPWRHKGELVDLPGRTLEYGRTTGLVPFERNVALLCGVRDESLIPRASFFQLNRVRKARAEGKPLSVIAHEDVLVFRKPQGGK